MQRHWALILALLLGGAAGIACHTLGWKDTAVVQFLSTKIFYAIGKVFLNLIFMTVVPLVFSALVLGVLELGRGKGLGSAIGKAILFTVVLSSFSVLIGIALTQVFQPGRGVELDAGMVAVQKAALAKVQANASQAKDPAQTLVELVTDNPLGAAMGALKGDMLAFMVFALVFGLALTFLVRGGEKAEALVSLLEQVYAVCLKIIGFAMLLAPFAVFSLVFNTTVSMGPQIFSKLLFYVILVVAGLLLQQLVVYAGVLWLVLRKNPYKFFWACREVYLYAFSTASSNATLPRSLELAQKNLGLPNDTSRFVLTVGATANQNGTALFEGVTVLFLAQVYGVHLGMGAQIQVVLMSILAGIGTAGVPGGSLPLIMILLTQIGVPAEGLGIILGVDRFLDMCRTTLNVSGDLVIAALVGGRDRGGARSPATLG
ncbi:MAG: dicarboxylate/amino acid:cation symporter [Spirochaetes bacterium]|nr:dicarboxylate/amino acid:cation symporter [Spirochaetota bacterium]